MQRACTIAIVLVHALLVVAAFTSPWWLDWRLVALAAALFYLQLAIWGSCLLSIAQFGERDTAFHEWFLRELGVRPRPWFGRRHARRVLPPLVVAIAIGVQMAGHVPAVRL